MLWVQACEREAAVGIHLGRVFAVERGSAVGHQIGLGRAVEQAHQRAAVGLQLVGSIVLVGLDAVVLERDLALDVVGEILQAEGRQRVRQDGETYVPALQLLGHVVVFGRADDGGRQIGGLVAAIAVGLAIQATAAEYRGIFHNRGDGAILEAQALDTLQVDRHQDVAFALIGVGHVGEVAMQKVLHTRAIEAAGLAHTFAVRLHVVAHHHILAGPQSVERGLIGSFQRGIGIGRARKVLHKDDAVEGAAREGLVLVSQAAREEHLRHLGIGRQRLDGSASHAVAGDQALELGRSRNAVDHPVGQRCIPAAAASRLHVGHDVLVARMLRAQLVGLLGRGPVGLLLIGTGAHILHRLAIDTQCHASRQNC